MSDSKKALFIGLNTIDIHYYTHGFPAANSKIKANSTCMDLGGPATNAAITAAFLGCCSTLISPVGISPFADFIHENLKLNNVNTIDPVETNSFCL